AVQALSQPRVEARVSRYGDERVVRQRLDPTLAAGEPDFAAVARAFETATSGSARNVSDCRSISGRSWTWITCAAFSGASGRRDGGAAVGVPTDRQADDEREVGHRRVRNLSVDPQRGNAFVESLECDARGRPGEWRPHAEVTPAPEGHMLGRVVPIYV